MIWSQVYDPLGNTMLSTLVCAIPVVVLLGGLGIFHIRAHYAAISGLIAAVIVAMFVIGMPGGLTLRAGFYGALFAVTTICWIILNLIFLYRMTLKAGLFTVLQDSIGGITNDRRLQLVLIAFCFGAFFEGAAGGGTPVAVTGAILIGLGFTPLAASGLSLIANTAPVAFGGLGTPIIVLHSVTQPENPDYLYTLSAMVGRQLPFFSIIVPFWLVLTFCGWRRTMEIWPAILMAGIAFAVPQFLVSNYHGPWLVDMISAMVSMVILAVFLIYWKPKTVMLDASGSGQTVPRAQAAAVHHGHSRALVIKAWTPWVILTVVLFVWGIKWFKDSVLNLPGITYWEIPIDGLHKIVQRVAPAVAVPRLEPAIWKWGILSATGTGIFLAAIIAGFVMGFKPREMFKTWIETFGIMKYSLLTILAMLALGYITRYAGMDGTLGLAFANTGWLYPFFGTMIGWIGTALTGTDAASNALFGSQQVITANKLGLNPTLMAAANSSGGVMGKMIDAQSIVVASVATNQQGREGVILRFVFWHSISLAALVGILIMLQAYVPFFQAMIPK
jgi:lactate permease